MNEFTHEMLYGKQEWGFRRGQTRWAFKFFWRGGFVEIRPFLIAENDNDKKISICIFRTQNFKHKGSWQACNVFWFFMVFKSRNWNRIYGKMW